MKKRVLSLFLALTLCLTLTPTGALAAEGQPPEQMVTATQEAQIPAPALEEKEEEKTTPAQTGAGENAPPANPEENPTEDAPAAAEKNTVSKETGKEAGQNEPTVEGENEPLALGLDDPGQNAAEGENGEGSGGTHYVAESGGTQYETVQDILDNMEEEITLLDSVTENLTVCAATTIDMAGFSITGNIEATDSLTLNGGTVDGTVKVDGGTLNMTAPAKAEAAITGGLNVVSGSAFVSGAQVGVKGTLYFDGTDMLISGAVKAVELDNAAEPAAKTLYGSATVNGDTAAEAGFDTDTYKVGDEIAKKLTNKQVGSTTPAAPSLTLTETSKSLTAGKTAVFTANYTGTDTLNAYVQGSAVNGYFTISQKNNGDGTYTVSVKIDEETPGGTYTLFVHELGNTSVQASATITVTGLPDAAEVNGKQYKSLPRALNAARDGDTVKLLADHVTDVDALNALGEDFTFKQYASIVPVVTKTLTLDLNHKTVDYLEVGFTETNEETQKKETFATGNLTVTSEAAYGRISNLLFMAGALDIRGGEIGDSHKGGLTCDANSGSVTVSNGTVYGLTVLEGASVTVNGGSKHAGEWVVASGATLNITDGTFGEVQFTHNGTIAISGGTFKSIKSYIAEELQPLMSLLANGYAFYKDNAVQDSTAKTMTDVTVGAHTHVSDEHGKCACGASIIASVKTADGTERTYGSFTDALAAAVESNDSTLQLLYDIDLGNTKYGVSVDSGKFTLDLNSKTLSGKVDYQLLTVSGTADITIKNGKLVNTFSNDSPAMNRGLANAIQITGGTAVLENVEVTSGCGENGEHTDAVCLSDGNLTVANGTFTGAILVMPKTADQHPVLKITSATLHNGIGYFIWNTSNPDYDGVKALFADGSLLFDQDGNYIDITNAAYWQTDSSEEESFTATTFAYGEECSVKPHTHTIVNGKCSVCGEVEGDGCIAHAVWSPYADYPEWRTTHIKTMDELREKITSPGTKWLDFDNNATVTFLCDVTVDKTFLIDNYYTNIIIDLNGHTLSGALDGPVITANFVSGTGTIDFKNGKIVNTGDGEAIRLAKGKVTLENVDVTGDLSLTHVFVNSLSYIPTFLGGGSFTKICTVNDAGGWQKVLEDMLPKGYYFADITSGKRVSQTVLKADSPLENVTVKPCNHKDADGKSTFTYKPERQTYYYCSICGNICPHEHRTELADGKLHCEDCGLTLTAARRDSKNTITYYIDMSDAFGNAYQPIIWPLCNQTCTQAAMTYYGSKTIDLNGFTVTANNSSGVLFAPYVSDYKMTLQNSAENQGHYVCEYLQVYNDGTLAIPAENNNLTISAVLIKSDGNANLAGGSFGKISVEGEKTLAGLLVSGYYFADTASGEPAAMYDADGTALTELTNVTVQPCSHDTAVCGSDGVWKCLCGQNVFVASVTKDGTPTYYTDLQNAFSAADGNTVKLLANVQDVTVNTDKPFTFDLNGYNVYSLTVNNKITIKDSATVKGKITEWLKVPSGMTVGELLEDGYAFKKSNGTWCSGVEQAGQAVGDVSIWPVPIRSVTAANPSVTVAYGQTSGVTLTATVVPFAEGGTYTCQWYKIGGTVSPLDGATDSTYQLPVNLAAGTYTYRLTATEDGYEKSCDFTVTVTPVSIERAAVNAQNLTYNGNAQNPTATVSLGETVLTENRDYTVTATPQTDVGSYMLTVTGKGNYTGKIENVNWKIEPMQLYRFCDIEPVTKVYDGTAVAPIAKSALAFHDANARGASVTLPEDAYDITNARFTMRQSDGTYVESPEAGNGKSLSFTVTLTSDNYVFESTTEDSKTIVCDIATDAEDKFTITKATAPTGIQTGTLNVVNGTTLEYTYDAKQILPAAPNGTYGTVLYSGEPSSDFESGYTVNSFKVGINSGVLTLTIDAQNGGKTGKIGSVTIYVTTDNYESFNLPLDLYAVNKITPVADGEITAAGITYGDALSKSTISGKMKDPNTGATVNGTFAWTDGTTKPDANDNYEAEWTFTPAAGYEKYATATGTVTIKVNKATPTFNAPTAQENLTYTGQEQALIIAGSVTSGGTMQYSLTENGTYSQDIPTGTDAGAYTVWYRVIGDANHNDTTPASVPVRIGKKPLTIIGVTAASKTYDGTTNADITSVTFDNVILNRDTDYNVTASFDDASVGNGKNVTATVTLIGPAAKNYALEQSSFTTTGSITKAAAPGSGLRPAVTVINDLAKTYEMVLSNDYLPKLSSPCEYGNVSYSLRGTYLTDGYKDTVQVKVMEENGQYKLKLTVPAVDYNKVSSVGTIDVRVTSDNYRDFYLTIGVKTKNKDVPVPDGTISASDITYGQALNDSKIAGKMKAGGKAIDGTFTWTNGTFKPAAGDYPASWTFTPAEGYEEYATATGTATVTVDPKAVTVSITPNGGSYGGTITPATATANDVVGEDAPEITLTYTGTANDGTEYNGTTPPTKAGTYTIKASTTNANYTLDANTATAEFSVAKRRATVTPDNKSKVYQEKDPDLTYKVGGVLDGETLTGITLTRAEGENTGMYAITATADTGANPNYDVTFAEGTLTIEPKSIKGAKVVLGKALTANGAEQTQTVEKVLLDDKEIPADSYTVTGNTATAPGSHTLTITAKGNYTGTVEQTYVIVPAKAEDAPGEEIAIGSGEVKVVVKSEGTVPPATLLTNKAELLAMLVDSGDITADELAQIADGASVDIALTVKEANVSAEIKTAMAQAAKGCTIGQYLDISLFKYMTVNGKQQDGVALHTTKNALTISVVVPDALINTNSAVNRTYCIVRNHEGTITVLDAAFDAASKTLTFKTDRFSDYAIAYKDTAVPSSGSNPGSNNSSNGSETKKNEVAAPTPTPTPASTSKPSTITAMPQTGDTSNPTLYVVLLVASLLGLAVVFVCKKRNNK